MMSVMRTRDVLYKFRLSVVGRRADESAPCAHRCGALVAPHDGVRSGGEVFCSERCRDEDRADGQAW